MDKDGKNSKDSKEPALRFKGFAEEWEEKKLGEILQYEQPQSYQVQSTEYNDAYNTPVLTAGHSFILGYTNETQGIKDATPKAPIIIFDDFTTSSNYVDFPFKVKSSAMKLLSLTNFADDIYCIYHILKNIGYIPVTHKRHWITQFAKYSVRIPHFSSEQQLIGTFFYNIDNLISLQQQKLNKLEDFKKAMLDKMFPQKGARVPQIRFKGFTGLWEEQKAGLLFTSTADKGYPDLPVLAATQDRGMVRRDQHNINIFHNKENEKAYKRVLPGQFVIHLRSFQGGFAYSSIEGITSPAYTVFGLIEPDKHCSQFWKYIFSLESFIKRLETVTYGIRDGRSISYDEFLTLSFLFPSKEEQTKIAQYLESLDRLISLHRQKLEKLQSLKKAMLGQMFLAPPRQA